MAAAISKHKMMKLVLHVKKTNLQIKNQPLGWERFQTWAISLQLFGNRKLYFRNKLWREKCSFQAHKGLFKTATEDVLPPGTGHPGTPTYTPNPSGLPHLRASLLTNLSPSGSLCPTVCCCLPAPLFLHPHPLMSLWFCPSLFFSFSVRLSPFSLISLLKLSSSLFQPILEGANIFHSAIFLQ